MFQASNEPTKFERYRGILKGKLTTEDWMRATRGNTWPRLDIPNKETDQNNHPGNKR